MNAQKYKSHAKINLGLKVVNKREDGYHNIDRLFVELNLHDTISFSPSDTFSLSTNSVKELKNIIEKNILNKLEQKQSIQQSKFDDLESRRKQLEQLFLQSLNLSF